MFRDKGIIGVGGGHCQLKSVKLDVYNLATASQPIPNKRRTNETFREMTDLQTKPRSGQLLNSTTYTAFINNYLDLGHRTYPTHRDFTSARGDRLSDHERGLVTRMRVPFAPYYDTTFILKWFNGGGFPEAASEQADGEAASLHHAAEAFQRNNIGRVPRVYACRTEDRYIAMERIHGRIYRHRDSRQYLWPKERMIRFVRPMVAIRLAMMTQVENQLGVPRVAQDGGRVGPHCGPPWCENDRVHPPPPSSSPSSLGLV